MTTSSITKNFVLYGKKQAEIFADAIEESYQESLHKNSRTWYENHIFKRIRVNQTIYGKKEENRC